MQECRSSSVVKSIQIERVCLLTRSSQHSDCSIVFLTACKETYVRDQKLKLMLFRRVDAIDEGNYLCLRLIVYLFPLKLLASNRPNSSRDTSVLLLDIYLIQCFSEIFSKILN